MGRLIWIESSGLPTFIDVSTSTAPGTFFTRSTSWRLSTSSFRRSGPLITNWTSAPCAPPPPITATCQHRGHGIGTPAMDLMALIPGLRARQVDAVCCGVAGTYGLKVEKYDIAMAVGASLFDQVRASGAELSVCDSETCRWQIAQATDLPSVHPVVLLHRAYGLS